MKNQFIYFSELTKLFLRDSTDKFGDSTFHKAPLLEMEYEEKAKTVRRLYLKYCLRGLELSTT